MSLKTLLVHLDGGARCAARVELAIEIARRHGSHLLGLAPTGLPDVIVTLNSEVPDQVEFIELSAAALQERAEAAVEAFERQVAHGDLVSTEARVVRAEPLDAVVQASRCCDLLIVGQTDRAGNVAGVAWDFPRHAVLQGGVPVLVVPFAGTFSQAGECVLVAWKD
ncbi:MAG: universal stress protein, partial [Caldimonas sp.]